MLTQEQLNNLEPLSKHERFGTLLSDAIKIWSKEGVTPIYASYGLNYRYLIELDPFNRGCCLIGASVVGSVYFQNLHHTVSEKFNLSECEIEDLVLGFDSFRSPKEDSEAFNFGKSVAKILFL